MQKLADEFVSPAREQEVFGTMFEQAGFGVAQVSLDGQWLAVNQSLCDILGYSRPELLGRSLREITRFDGIDAEFDDCRQLLSGERQSFSAQKRHLRRDGRVVWLKATITLVRDDVSGQPGSYLAVVEDLTPQKKAIERVLLESDKRFHVLADNISDLFFTLDIDLKCTYWNKAAESLTGISSREALGKKVGEVFAEGRDSAGVDEAYREVLAVQQARSFAFKCKVGKKDLLLEAMAYPAKDGIAVVARDIAAKKEAEEALRNSEQKFAKAFEASPAIIAIVRIGDRRYLEVNRAFEQHTGFMRSEILGRSITDVARTTDLQGLNHAFESVVAHGSVRNMEVRFRRKSGEAMIALLSAEVVEFDAQSCVLTVAEDITERKQAEDALRESEERFRVMADSAPIMMWMAGVDKGCTDFNRGWLGFTGRSAAEEYGEGWVAGVHPADVQGCLSAYHAAFDNRHPFTMEYRLKRQDGEYRWVTDTGVARFLPDGEFVGYIGCCIDVDDQKQAELARIDLSRRLMTAQEAERTRIARELHDGIGQSLALLGIQIQRSGQPEAKRAGAKSLSMLELCAKLKEIGNQVSRISHQLHSSELEFLGLAVAVKSLCREFSEQYRIEIECLCTDIPSDLDNEIALSFLRIVQEALHNVAKHSQATAVRVDLTGKAEGLSLDIADNGTGFEATTIRKSVGLGMVSMRERMHLIGGDFSIVSRPGSGTRILAKAPLTVRAG